MYKDPALGKHRSWQMSSLTSNARHHSFFNAPANAFTVRCNLVLSGEFGVDEGTEFVGEVGDVILWHNFLVRAQHMLCFLPIHILYGNLMGGC